MFQKYTKIKRGSIHGNQMPDRSSKTLRGLSDEHLHEYIAGIKENTAHHIGGMRELERRKSTPAARRSWVAIIISAIALIVSLLSISIK